MTTLDERFAEALQGLRDPRAPSVASAPGTPRAAPESQLAAPTSGHGRGPLKWVLLLVAVAAATMLAVAVVSRLRKRGGAAATDEEQALLVDDEPTLAQLPPRPAPAPLVPPPAADPPKPSAGAPGRGAVAAQLASAEAQWRSDRRRGANLSEDRTVPASLPAGDIDASRAPAETDRPSPAAPAAQEDEDDVRDDPNFTLYEPPAPAGDE